MLLDASNGSGGLAFGRKWGILKNMDIAIECNESAFRHNVHEEDIRCAFATAKYDGWFEEGQKGDK